MSYNPATYIDIIKRSITVKEKQLKTAKDELNTLSGDSGKEAYSIMRKAEEVRDVAEKIVSKEMIVSILSRNALNPLRTLDLLYKAHGDSYTADEDIAEAINYVLPALSE